MKEIATAVSQTAHESLEMELVVITMTAVVLIKVHLTAEMTVTGAMGGGAEKNGRKVRVRKRTNVLNLRRSFLPPFRRLRRNHPGLSGCHARGLRSDRAQVGAHLLV